MRVTGRLSASLLVLPWMVSTALALTVGEPVSDWSLAVAGGRYLMGGHLSIYADMPKVQMGPLALLMAGVLPGPVYLATVTALLPLVLWMMTLGYSLTARTRVVALVGGVLLAWPWAAFAVQGHADDALVMVGVVAMVSGLRSQRQWWVVGGFLIAITGKPTAVLFLPLTFGLARSVPVICTLAGGLLWAPFVLVNLPGFLAAGRGQGDTWPYSLPNLLGGQAHAGFPVWVRPAQLVGGAALCLLLARRNGPAAAVAGVVAFRVLMEPGTWNYYSASVVTAAILLDLDRSWRLPWATTLGFLSFVAAFGVPLNMAEGVVRIATLVGVLALALFGSMPRPGHRGREFDGVLPVGTSSTTRTGP